MSEQYEETTADEALESDEAPEPDNNLGDGAQSKGSDFSGGVFVG